MSILRAEAVITVTVHDEETDHVAVYASDGLVWLTWEGAPCHPYGFARKLSAPDVSPHRKLASTEARRLARMLEIAADENDRWLRNGVA